MRTAPTLVLFLAIILNSFDSSSHFDFLPNGAPIPHVPRSNISHIAGKNQSPRKKLPTARSESSCSPVRSYPTVGSSLHVRSRSPCANRSMSHILKFNPEQLRSIRLAPRTNPNRLLEIRRYTFPPDKSIRVRGNRKVIVPTPTEEQIVLSTTNGDVFAIIVKNPQSLRGLYTSSSGIYKRAKINIHSGAVEEMNQGEILDTPLGTRSILSRIFRVVNLSELPRRQ